MIKQIPGGGTKKYLIYHISKNNHYSKKRFRHFTPQVKALPMTIFLSDFTKNYNTFW